VEVADPALAQRETRDRYLLRSLAEEAITSSQLEGASTTRKVAKEMLLTGRAPRTKDERMIANNFRGMEFVRTQVDEPITRAGLLRLHEILTEGTLEEADVGRFRRADELVNVVDHADGSVLHMPPSAEQLPQRLDALLAFANGGDEAPFVHPIIRAITVHFGLAYEHPFVDGNGRTARALFYWSMLRSGYWMAEFLSISRVLKKAPAQYSRAFLLTETDDGDLTYFLLHQLSVLQTAIKDLHSYLARKAEQLKEADALISSESGFNHRQRTLLADAVRHPSARYTIEAYRRQYGVVYQTARADLLGLAEAGLLKKIQIGKAFHFEVIPELERTLKRRR
ncbi:MAG: Fic family protein, partial [Myxococcaceae bacterium]